MELAPQQQHAGQAPALLAYHVPPPSRRPAAVPVLAVLGLVLAGLGGFFHAAVVIFYGTALALGRSSILDSPQATWRLVLAAGGIVFWAALVRASVAALRIRPWARRAMVRWAAAFLVWALVTAVLTCTVIVELELAGAPPEARDKFRFSTYTRTAVGTALEAIYPAVLLAFMARRKVRAAFGPPPSDGALAALPVPSAPAPVLPVATRPELSPSPRARRGAS